MKLSQAIKTQYRGNLMFHTQDVLRDPPAEAHYDVRVSADVEQAFDATFEDCAELSFSARGELRPAEVDSEDPLGH